MPGPLITEVEIAVLQVIAEQPGVRAKEVKTAAGLTPDHPRYYKCIRNLYLRGLLWSHGHVGWEPSIKGKALLAELPKETVAAARQWQDHPTIRPDRRKRGRPPARPHLRLV